MTLNSNLTRALQEWRSAPRPMENFRAGRIGALSFGIECDLDHQLSYIEGMITELQKRNPYWDFAMRAEREARDLAEFSSRVDAIELPPREAKPLRCYIAATERLLSAIIQDPRLRATPTAIEP